MEQKWTFMPTGILESVSSNQMMISWSDLSMNQVSTTLKTGVTMPCPNTHSASSAEKTWGF